MLVIIVFKIGIGHTNLDISRVRLLVTSMTFSDSLIISSFVHLIDNKHIIIANGIGYLHLRKQNVETVY